MAVQVLQRRFRRLTEDLKRDVAAEVDGLASQVCSTTLQGMHDRLTAGGLLSPQAHLQGSSPSTCISILLRAAPMA